MDFCREDLWRLWSNINLASHLLSLNHLNLMRLRRMLLLETIWIAKTNQVRNSNRGDLELEVLWGRELLQWELLDLLLLLDPQPLSNQLLLLIEEDKRWRVKSSNFTKNKWRNMREPIDNKDFLKELNSLQQLLKTLLCSNNKETLR